MVLAYSCGVCAWHGTEPQREADGVTRCPECAALAEPATFKAPDDGGPAFPRPVSDYMGQWSGAQDGMSLRDYFAAKAMHAELNTAGAHAGAAKALREAAEEAGQTICERIAFNAYRLADAMLAERSRRS